jgi:hypothetical protein
MNLSSDDMLVLLGYKESCRHVLEILGFEYSSKGRQLYSQKSPSIGLQLIECILGNLKINGFFPSEYEDSHPDSYCAFIENGNCLVEIDKPDLVTRSWYNTPEMAAHALILKRVDSAWVKDLGESPSPNNIEHS